MRAHNARTAARGARRARMTLWRLFLPRRPAAVLGWMYSIGESPIRGAHGCGRPATAWPRERLRRDPRSRDIHVGGAGHAAGSAGSDRRANRRASSRRPRSLIAGDLGQRQAASATRHYSMADVGRAARPASGRGWATVAVLGNHDHWRDAAEMRALHSSGSASQSSTTMAAAGRSADASAASTIALHPAHDRSRRHAQRGCARSQGPRRALPYRQSAIVFRLACPGCRPEARRWHTALRADARCR